MRNDDASIAAARLKSYTARAVIALVLTFPFWIIGFVLSVIWRLEAKRMERIAGTSLPGVGCLTWVLAFQIFSVAVMVLATVVASLVES